MLERVWRKGNPLILLVAMQTSTATMENSVDISWTVHSYTSYPLKLPFLSCGWSEICTTKDSGHIIYRRKSLSSSWDPSINLKFVRSKDTVKDWGQEEKGSKMDEIVRWYHWVNGHEFEQIPRDSGDWSSAVHGVAKSQTRLWLNSKRKFIKCYFYFSFSLFPKNFS